MAAPLPTGSSLQALPVAPSFNPMLGVANVDPLANVQKGVDFAGTFARLGQLRSKIELEDAQRKAEMAKSKAALLEADIMQRDLETKQAIEMERLKQEALNAQLTGTNLGIAGDTGRFNLRQSEKDAAFKDNVRKAALAQLAGPGEAPVGTPAPLAAVSPDAEAEIAVVPEAGAPAAVVVPFKPTHNLASWLRAPQAVEILNTGAPVSPAALAKKLGVERKTRSFIDPTTKSEYEVDVQEGPAGEVFGILSEPRFVKVSPLQGDVDKKTADDISEFNNGGKEKALAQIAKLDDAIKALESGSTIAASGPIVGLLPEKLRAPFTTDKTLAIKKDVRQAIQTSLKATLGSQFTEKEAERIIDAAFSESLSEEANAERLRKTKAELEALLSAKAAQVEFFRKNGTLAGFSPVVSPVPVAGVELDAGLPRNQALSTVSTNPDDEIRVDAAGRKWKKINGVVTQVGG